MAATLRGILFPDAGRQGVVASAWRDEARAAAGAGFEVLTVDVAALEDGETDATTSVPAGHGRLLRRGPELSAEAYARLDLGLRARGWRLVPGVDAWRAVHLVPTADHRIGAYLGATTAWTQGFDFDAAWSLFRRLGGDVIVHDHVSPCSQPCAGMMFVARSADRVTFDAALAEVLAVRGPSATGGFVLRRPPALVPSPGEPPTEPVTRVVLWRGVDLLTHGWATPSAVADGLRRIARCAESPFLAIDLVGASSPRARVVGIDEGGDVDLPEDTDLGAFYARLRALTG